MDQYTGAKGRLILEAVPENWTPVREIAARTGLPSKTILMVVRWRLSHLIEVMETGSRRRPQRLLRRIHSGPA
ncbi:MAG: hypothetical protein QXD04_05575 [Candidatus Bathyarchaeia archaeon]